mgnify:CR=1 FL=1
MDKIAGWLFHFGAMSPYSSNFYCMWRAACLVFFVLFLFCIFEFESSHEISKILMRQQPLALVLNRFFSVLLCLRLFDCWTLWGRLRCISFLSNSVCFLAVCFFEVSTLLLSFKWGIWLNIISGEGRLGKLLVIGSFKWRYLLLLLFSKDSFCKHKENTIFFSTSLYWTCS